MRKFCIIARREKLNVVTRYHECLAIVVRAKIIPSDNHANVERHSYECLTTVVRVSRNCRATVVRHTFKIVSKFAILLYKCPSIELAIALLLLMLISHWHANSVVQHSYECGANFMCRELVANHSRKKS